MRIAFSQRPITKTRIATSSPRSPAGTAFGSASGSPAASCGRTLSVAGGGRRPGCSGAGADDLEDALDHVVELLFGESRVDADPEAVVHDLVCVNQGGGVSAHRT